MSGVNVGPAIRQVSMERLYADNRERLGDRKSVV